jgi:hypothetical protein
MNETFVVPCWNVTLLFVVMNRLHDLRTGITGYGSNFKYSLAIDGVRRGLQRRFNRLSDMMVDVNKQRMIDNQTYVKHILQLAGEENLVDDFSTGIRRHTFKLPASGPREEGTVVNKSTASDIKLQFLQNTSTVMHRPNRFTTFTLGLAR